MIPPRLTTAAFEVYLAPARPRRQVWRLVAGVAVIAALYIGGVLGLSVAVSALGGARGHQLLNAMATGSSPPAMLLLLGSFGLLAIATLIAARLLQRRGLRSLIGRPAKALRDFVRAVAVVAAVYSVIGLIWSGLFDAVPNLELGTWAALLPLSLLAVAVQTLAEELTFRAYLMQQLAARFRSALIWMGLPTVGFALLHYDPATSGPNTWHVVGGVFLFGLAAADLTRRSGSLGAAWGFHFANNAVALLILATGRPLSGLALLRTPYAASDPILHWAALLDIASILVSWAIIARLTAGRGAA